MDVTLLINIALAFIEGLVLVVSPCILPLLPILLAESLEGDKKHPLGVITGFILAFAIFSLFAKQVVQILNIDLGVIRTFSFILLSLFGIIMLSEALTEKFTGLALKFMPSRCMPRLSTERGFFRGLLFGSLLGIVWTPCAGPILAVVIVQTVIGQTTLASFLILIAFGIGVSVPLLSIIFGMKCFLNNLSFFKKNSRFIRKALGVLILIGVLLMIYADKILFWFTMPLNNINNSISIPTITLSKYNTSQQTPSLLTFKKSGLINGLMKPYSAPPLANIQEWINTKPIEISNLKGKVILVDFWAYSCINCIRTLPYLNSWYQKYKEHDFVILGVHTPEFQFEQNLDNVKNAVQEYGIEYPVLLDNFYSTWHNYQNQYWPASYLINQKGEVVYIHFGEGNYDVTEANIRTLLGLSSREIAEGSRTEKQERPLQQLLSEMQQTPETYLGYERSQNFKNAEAISLFYTKPYVYHYPDHLQQNEWALKGSWSLHKAYILSNEANASIQLHFYASKVYAVMGSQTGHKILVKVLLNGKPLQPRSGITQEGKDVHNSEVLLDKFRLYEIIHLNEPINGTIEFIVTEPGAALYTFTFGSE